VVCFLVTACVSKEKYEELEATLADTRTKLEQKSRNLEELERKHAELEERLNKFTQDKSEIQSRLQELEQKEQVLSETIAQKQALIVRVDEARRRLENKLQSQIETRKQKIKELEAAAESAYDLAVAGGRCATRADPRTGRGVRPVRPCPTAVPARRTPGQSAT